MYNKPMRSSHVVKGNIKIYLYIIAAMAVIHIVISMAMPAARLDSGFSYSTLREIVIKPGVANPITSGVANPITPGVANPLPTSGDAEEFPPPVYVAEQRAGVPANLRIFLPASGRETYSHWYESSGDFYIMIGGFPFLKDNSLQLEIESANGAIERRPLTDKVNPRKVMVLRKLHLNPDNGPYKVRIAAKRGAPGDTTTWFAVSEPFIITGRHGALMSVVRLALSVFAAVVLVFGPGLALRTYLKEDSILRALAFVPLPGVVILAICALICWALAPGVNPQVISTAFSLACLALCVYVLGLRSAPELVSKMEWKVLGIVFVVILIAVAKAGYSVGPYEEFYGGTISRTLDAGGRPDSRL